MRGRLLRCAAAVACLLSMGIGPGVASETLTVGGTGMGLSLMERLGAVFAATPRGSRIVVPPSLGSSGGVRALSEGALDLAVTARPLKDKEKASGARAVAIARTPFILVSSHPEPGNIASKALAAHYASEAPVWPDGRPLRVILRHQNDSDAKMLIDHFPGMAQALEIARARGFLPVARNDQENLALANRIEGSLTSASLMQVVGENADLRVMSVDGIAPTPQALVDGSYRIFKTLYLVVPPRPSERARAFIEFLRGPEAQAIIRDAGAVGAR